MGDPTRHFGKASKERLQTCNWRLQEIHNKALPGAPYDYGIACGYRSAEDQQIAYDSGKSNAKPGESAHNIECDGEPDSAATDIYVWHGGRAWWGDESPIARGMVRETQRYISGVAAGLDHPIKVMPTLRNGAEDLGHSELDRR